MTVPAPLSAAVSTPTRLTAPTPLTLLRLVTNPGKTHLGFPPGGQVSWRLSEDLALVSAPGLDPGDEYLFTLDSLLGHVLLQGLDMPEGVRTGLAAVAASAAAEATQIVGLLPLVWTVPSNQGAPVPTLAHLSVVFSGIFGTPTAAEEIWSFALKTTLPAGDPTGPALNTIADACHAAWVTNLGPISSAHLALTATTVAMVDATGHWQRFGDGAYKVGRNLVVAPGTLGDGNAEAGVVYPLQTALVVSLMTTRPGSSGRGRFYVPFQGWKLNSRFLLPDATVQRFLDGGKALVSAVSAAAGPVQVYSGGATVNGIKGAPFASPVVGVRVGHVVDTQRSRRNRQVESYTGSAL